MNKDDIPGFVFVVIVITSISGGGWVGGTVLLDRLISQGSSQGWLAGSYPMARHERVAKVPNVRFCS